MATSAYYNWLNSGRAWRLAQPIADIVDVVSSHGIPILGTIGNTDHLTADIPEDHTPFSYTAWPVPAPGWVCACDLADQQGLGAAILRDARAGKLPWLKYANIGNRHYEHDDGFQSSSYSGDAHIHLSCRSDWTTRGIGTYDPLEDDMELSDIVPGTKTPGFNNADRTFGQVTMDVANDRAVDYGERPVAFLPAGSPKRRLYELLPALEALVANPAGVDITALAAALQPAIGVAVANEIARRMQE